MRIRSAMICRPANVTDKKIDLIAKENRSFGSDIRKIGFLAKCRLWKNKIPKNNLCISNL